MVEGWNNVFDNKELDEEEVKSIAKEIHENDSAIFVFTSGTTGPSKAAMISHKNILCSLHGFHKAFPVDGDLMGYAFLPLSHVAGRLGTNYYTFGVGTRFAICSSIASLLTETEEVRPTVLGGVPRIFEKAYAKIQQAIEKMSPVKKKLVNWAVSVGIERQSCVIEKKSISLFLGFKYSIASRLLSKIREKLLGGNVFKCVTGAAPIGMDILKFFWAIDVKLYECYGMTEVESISHCNSDPFGVKLGTVGKQVNCIETKVAQDGEILMKGDSVFLGYYHNEKKTREALDKDGWLHSGDIGFIDENGFLKITDRKKHLIITAGGKNLAPASIENTLKDQSPVIGYVHAHGDKRPYVSALISPSVTETLDFGVGNKLISQEKSNELIKELMKNPLDRSDELNSEICKISKNSAFIEKIKQAISKGNERLAQVEKVKRFVILGRDFSVGGGELTATSKLKRRAVERKFKDTFEKIYTQNDFAIQFQK